MPPIASQFKGKHVSFSYPERYFDGDAQAFRYRQKRFETWWENGQKMGRWEWVPAVWNGAWCHP